MENTIFWILSQIQTEIAWPDKSWFYCEICFSNLRVFRFRRAIENRTWGSEAHISEKWYPNIIRKCDNDRESYDDRKCDNDQESYRVPKKKWPQKKRFLAIFSCWMVLYGPKQCCMIRAYRCAALDTPLAYIRKKNWPQAPWGPKKGQKGPFGALDVKIRMYGCEATEIAVVLAPTYLW